MTFVLVCKLLRDIRWPLLTVWLLLFVFSTMWVKIAQRVTTEIAPFFNTLGLLAKLPNVKDTFDEIVFKGPGKVSQAVLGGAEIRFDQANDFLAVQMLHPVVMTLAWLWAVGRTSSAVSGELDRGTMELLMSQPIPRNRLIYAHLIVDAIVLPVLALSLLLGTQLGLELAGPFEIDPKSFEKLPMIPKEMTLDLHPPGLNIDTTRHWLACLNLVAFMFSLSGVAILISAYGRNRWRALAYCVLIVLVMFVINVLGQLWSEAAFARPLSLFFYYQPQRMWLHNNWMAEMGEAWNGGKPLFGVPAVPFLFAVGALGYWGALRIFTGRDLPAPL